MPTYVYECSKCDEELEVWQSFKDDALKRHSGCGGKLTKVLQPVGIVLKGPGFYKTDSRNGKKSSDSSEGSDSSSDSSPKTESTTESKKSDPMSGSARSGSARSDSKKASTPASSAS
jgi:putative FmdB family regulatory protein